VNAARSRRIEVEVIVNRYRRQFHAVRPPDIQRSGNLPASTGLLPASRTVAEADLADRLYRS
jgi:hypothetical protein